MTGGKSLNQTILVLAAAFFFAPTVTASDLNCDKKGRFCVPADVGLPKKSPRVGNGGGVWVCKDRPTKSTRWMELVDLFEMRVEHGYQLAGTGTRDSWQILTYMYESLQHLSPSLKAIIRQSPRQLKEVTRVLPSGSALQIINDVKIRVYPAPELCEEGYLYYGQLANYTNDGRLLISGEFWNNSAFSELQRGALLVHEMVYKALRDHYGDRYSPRARHIVGILFSNLPIAIKAEKIHLELAKPPEVN